MTALNKQVLREHYSPKPVPKCHICGAEMTIQRMSVLRTTYGCTGATYDDKGCHYAEGRSIADDHYAQSSVTVVDLSDPEVLAVLDELEATESKCRELAVENSTIKVMNDCLSEELRGYESDGAFEGPKMHLLWWKAETPATDAFLAEVRAQSASELIAAFSKHVSASGLNDSSVVTILECEDAMQHVAAQLRKGAAL